MIGDARVDAGDPGSPLERGELSLRNDEREPVDDDAVATAHDHARDLAAEMRLERSLARAQLPEIRNGCRRPEIEPRRGAVRGQGPHAACVRERRRIQDRDDLDKRSGTSRWVRPGRARQGRQDHERCNREEEDPLQNGHGRWENDAARLL